MRKVGFVATHNVNKKRYYRIEHAGYKSNKFHKSASKTVFHFRYIISVVCSTNMSKHCKNKQYFTCSLNASMGYSTK